MRYRLPTALLVILSILLGSPELVSAQSLAERMAGVSKARQKRNKADQRYHLLQTLLFTPMTVDFEQTPAREALDAIRTTLGINMIARYHDDPAGHGIDPNDPITLEVEDIPAVEVLNQVLEQCSKYEPCTWQLRKSFVEVGTKERLASRSSWQMQIYPVSDILYEPPSFDDAPALGVVIPDGGYGSYGGYGGTGGGGYSGSIRLIQGDSSKSKEERGRELVDLITLTIEPDAWDIMGGDWATIRYYNGSLIVRAPDFIQRQIGGYPRIAPPAEAATKEPTVIDRSSKPDVKPSQSSTRN